MKVNPLKRLDVIILTVILLVGLLCRLYRVNAPLADYHSWRQADTAAVARNFARQGFNLLEPKYDDFSSVESGIENPTGLRFVEFPIYNAIFGTMYSALPVLNVETYGRITTALFSLLIMGILYYLAFKENGRVAAIVAAGAYAVFPFFIFFSRVVLPETTAIAFALLSILFLYWYSYEKPGEKSIAFLVISGIFFAASILVKPTVIFYALVLIYLFVRKYKLKVFFRPEPYLFFIISIVPFALWRYYISSHPEAIPASDWLITSVNTYEGLKNIFFKPAFFRWIFFERINNNMLGGFATFLMLLGIVARQRTLLFHSLFLAALIYLFTFQGGNVQHEYYQTIILPAIAIMIGLGTAFIVQNRKLFINQYVTYIVLFFVFSFSIGMSYYKVRDFYYYPPEFPNIGKVMSYLTKPEDKIVTDRSGDTTLLYVIDRRGSPALYKDLEAFKSDGYKYFLSTNEDKTKEVKESNQYKLIFESDKFAIFEL